MFQLAEKLGLALVMSANGGNYIVGVIAEIGTRVSEIGDCGQYKMTTEGSRRGKIYLAIRLNV